MNGLVISFDQVNPKKIRSNITYVIRNNLSFLFIVKLKKIVS